MTVPNFRVGPTDFASLLPYIAMVLVMAVVLGCVPVLVWLERVVLALIQDRLGPNRVGPRGVLQPIADGIKLFFKEDIRPRGVDVPIYYLAPVLALIPPLAAGAVIPLGLIKVDCGNNLVRTLPVLVSDVNIGVLWILGLTSLQVYGLVLGGWSANNKYSLLGGLRSSAQVISYELAMTLGLLAACLMAGSLRLQDMVSSQAGSLLHWHVFRSFGLGAVAAGIYLVAMVAETNRTPFDLPEAESELVAGFHTEYSSMKFAIYFMGEYASMFVACCVATLLWFGGWLPPVAALAWVPGPVWLGAKVGVLVGSFIWVRATLPRMRYDSLMRFGWRRLLPVALVLLMALATVEAVRTPASAASKFPPKPTRPKPTGAGLQGV